VSTERGLASRAARPPSLDGGAVEDEWGAAAAPRLTRRQFALHGATTGPTSLPDDIGVARTAGFDAIEIGDDKLTAYAARGGELAELRKALALVGLGALSLYGSHDRTAVAEWRDRGMRERWRAFCSRAASVGCANVIATPGAGEAVSGGALLRERAAALGAMADIAAGFGLRTALEFSGSRDCAVRTVAAARELVDAARAGVGLVIDAFHFHVGGSTWAMLDGLDAASVSLVRLVDADARPPGELTDRDRLLAGDGVFPLRDLVRHVEALGADRPYSVKLSAATSDGSEGPGYAHWGASRLARAARESAESLCAEVDEQDGRLDYA
jgi:2-keto-myo-inositol isomerase